MTAATFLGYRDTALIAELTIVYADGTAESIVTDSSWTARESKLRYTNIYDGDIYDATFKAGSARHCICVDLEKDMLIPQEGEKNSRARADACSASNKNPGRRDGH
ncbi:MAG: alpha-L-rhamnosidase N-terminal domain-containing protein [Acutalibacteraceae bacterium]